MDQTCNVFSPTEKWTDFCAPKCDNNGLCLEKALLLNRYLPTHICEIIVKLGLRSQKYFDPIVPIMCIRKVKKINERFLCDI